MKTLDALFNGFINERSASSSDFALVNDRSHQLV